LCGNEFCESDRLWARGKRGKKEMKTITKIGAVLMAIIALALMPAAAFAAETVAHAPSAHHSNLLFWLVSVGLSVAGTVTVTYSSFAADNSTPQFGTGFTGGSAVAPTAQQSAQVNRINALIGFTDADTTITLTHNWGLSAAAIAANEPDIVVRDFALGSSGTQGAGLTWAVTSNTIVGTKANTAGAGRTQCVTLRLPASPGN
jgi:hypothetical protein